MAGSIGFSDVVNNSSSSPGKSIPVQTLPVGTGFYEFRSNVEGAEIYLDNQEIGSIKDGTLKIPIQIYEKPVTRQLRIQAPGYSSYSEILVKNPRVGEIMVVRGILQVLPINLTGSLSLAISPPGSQVSIDNISAGIVDQSGIMTIRTVNSGNRKVIVTNAWIPGFTNSGIC